MHWQVSEGMDFADHRARAVVVTGIPFAPAKDPKARAEWGLVGRFLFVIVVL